MSIAVSKNNNFAPSPSDSKPTTEAKIEAAKVLGDFAATVNGPASQYAFSRSNLESMLTNSHYDGDFKQNVEIPQSVRDAAKMVLEDDAMFDRVDADNDNLLGAEELNAFASTNAALSKIFKI